ncbi:hypothetical protein TNCV_2068071 [Trichonephila clavipes]|uniref:Uncharacterized protein n=1 Tax=Trichonephila clavipes TaxID=2585209 RepID=A0A8X6W3H3_TRICX|nr:hypothetical protein TNCV_2068071 [Trichonephila clavipes]
MSPEPIEGEEKDLMGPDLKMPILGGFFTGMGELAFDCEKFEIFLFGTSSGVGINQPFDPNIHLSDGDDLILCLQITLWYDFWVDCLDIFS